MLNYTLKTNFSNQIKKSLTILLLYKEFHVPNKLISLLKGSEKMRAFAATRTGIALEYLLLAAAGAFSATIFPAVNWSILAWVILIPLFFSITACSNTGALLRGMTWGYFWSLCSFFWLREIALPIPFILSAVLGAFPAVWALLVHFLWKNLAYSVRDRLKGHEHLIGDFPFRNHLTGILFTLAAASLWCVTEWVRGWIITGLPWNYLGSSQWKNLPLIQICEFTGVFGVSFLAALFNMAFGLSLYNVRISLNTKKYMRPHPLTLSFLLLLACFTCGMHLMKVHKLDHEKVKIEAIGLIQCDISQRRAANYQLAKEALDVCAGLTGKLLKEDEANKNIVLTDHRIDTSLKLIVWPETAVPYAYSGGADISEQYRSEIGSFVERYRVPFLLGSIDFQPAANRQAGQYEYDVFNAALFVTESGGKIRDRYYKVHRVPFGEYVPFGNEFPELNKMIGMGRNLTPGKRLNPIEVIPGVKAGVSICYESVFPFISRGHAVNGANLLVVISNDAWYPASYEPDQHYVNGLFRAVETRLPLLRSGNSNYSVLISPRGELLESISPKSDPGKRMRAAKKFLVPIPLDPKPTFYSVYGDVFIALCGFISLCALIFAFANWRLFRTAQADAKLYKTISEGAGK